MTKETKQGNTEDMSVEDILKQAENMGDGFENVDENSLKQNFLLLLTSLSTVVQDDEEGKYKEGDFYLTAEDKNLGESITVVPVGYMQRFTCWSGGKDNKTSELVRSYTREELEQEVKNGSVLFKSIGNYETLEGFPISEEHVLFLHIEGEERGAMFICSSTRITPLKDWIAKMRNKKTDGDKVIPMFLQRWKLNSVKDINRKGQKFANIGKSGKISADYLGIVNINTFQEYIADSRKNVTLLFDKIASTNYLPEKVESTDETEGTDEKKKWD